MASNITMIHLRNRKFDTQKRIFMLKGRAVLISTGW